MTIDKQKLKSKKFILLLLGFLLSVIGFLSLIVCGLNGCSTKNTAIKTSAATTDTTTGLVKVERVEDIQLDVYYRFYATKSMLRENVLTAGVTNITNMYAVADSFYNMEVETLSSSGYSIAGNFYLNISADYVDFKYYQYVSSSSRKVYSYSTNSSYDFAFFKFRFYTSMTTSQSGLQMLLPFLYYDDDRITGINEYFSFDNDFDPFTFLGQSNPNKYNWIYYGSYEASSTTILRFNLFEGLFTCGNSAYTQIDLYFTGSYKGYVGTPTDYETIESSHLTYQFLEFIDSSGYAIQVNHSDMYNTGTKIICDNTARTWYSESFKTIRVVYEKNTRTAGVGGFIAYSNLDYFDYLSMMPSTSYGSVDTNVSNGLNLIGGAFTAIIPLLSIAIIPGISLGTLLFIPVIITIIIVIFRTIKK